MSGADADESEQVMHTSHLLLQAAFASGSISSVIGEGSVATFVGQSWVNAHPNVLPYIRSLESIESGSST
ncbi:hypothetical protein [Roseateles sp. YR242]|uniref:hypothetical protein n=1 Tax=Roseateles sp. YR242 TaxID=1855305 RepID=UPI001C430714|nr:hypothetical protein [Roseateles sp. YR242]